MPRLIVQIAEREYVQLNILDNVFIILSNISLDKALIKNLIIQNIRDNKDIVSHLSKHTGEFSLIRVNQNGEKYIEAFAFRSITSAYELFYVKTQSDDIIISDNFRNILSLLKKEERELSIKGIVDLFLFQRNYSNETYLKSINRLGHGERLTFNSLETSITTQLIQKIETTQREVNLEESIGIVDDLLGKYCSNIVDQSFNYINTLSGGVDSTLLQTYFQDFKNHSLSVAFDAEEFQPDVVYAKNASKLLNSNHTFIKLKEANYLNELKDSIAILGQPATDISSTIIYNNISKTNYDYFLTALGADAIFGAPVVKTILEKQAEKDKQTLAGINKPVTSIEGTASTNFMIARPQDVRLVMELFGMDIVNERLQNRINYVSKRIECNDYPKEKVFNHIQFGHIMGFFINNQVSVLRQVGHNYNKIAASPFITKELVDVSLLINLSERYLNKSNGTKPALKILLERKVPLYFVEKSKLGGTLPRTRYCVSGPLKDYFNNHNTPDFITGKFKKAVRNANWDNSWIVLYSILFSIWNEIIFKNENLRISNNCTEYSWDAMNKNKALMSVKKSVV